jgi:hypothetical protein
LPVDKKNPSESKDKVVSLVHRHGTLPQSICQG